MSALCERYGYAVSRTFLLIDVYELVNLGFHVAFSTDLVVVASDRDSRILPHLEPTRGIK
jgi:hypothetical protein